MAIRFRVAWDSGASPPCWVVAAVNDSDRSSGFVGPIRYQATLANIITLASWYGVQSKEIEFI